MDFLARDDEGKAVQMETTRDNLGGFLGTLGMLATDPLVVQQAADATYWRSLLNLQKTIQQFGVALTDWKKYERDGGPVAIATPALPALPPGFGSSVPPGIVTRYRFFANYLKGLPNYTHAIGLALAIEGGHASAPDLTIVKPDFTLELNGGLPFVKWTWQGLRGHVTALELRVNRGAGPVFLTIDGVPGYQDTEPAPATPAKWTYEGIWRLDDQRVGSWSNPVSITVGG